ncbi:MAG: hypothetical protein WAS21_11620 [Geminicoccaceae bacterium]
MKTISTRLILLILFSISLTFSLSSNVNAAAINTYTSLTSWQKATSGSTYFLENFKSITKDVSFRTATLKLKAFSFQQSARRSYGNFRNFVDRSPFQFNDNIGKTNASLYTKYGATTVTIIFGSPVYAWCADFFGAQTSELLSINLLSADGTTIATVPVNANTGFFGFMLSPQAPISRLTFQSRIANPATGIGQGFSITNIRGAYSR